MSIFSIRNGMYPTRVKRLDRAVDREKAKKEKPPVTPQEVYLLQRARLGWK